MEAFNEKLFAHQSKRVRIPTLIIYEIIEKIQQVGNPKENPFKETVIEQPGPVLYHASQSDRENKGKVVPLEQIIIMTC